MKKADAMNATDGIGRGTVFLAIVVLVVVLVGSLAVRIGTDWGSHPLQNSESIGSK